MPAVRDKWARFEQAHEILDETHYPLYIAFIAKVKNDDFSGFFGKRRMRSLKDRFIQDFLKPFSSDLGFQGELDSFYDDFCEVLIAEIKQTFHIFELEDRFVIRGVLYRDFLHVVELKKGLLDDGQLYTQDEWVDNSRKALKKNGFVVGSAPLYHALFKTLYRKRNDTRYHDLVEKVRVQLQTVFAHKWVCTLSSVTYMPVGRLDVVTHDVGMPDKYTVHADVVGPQGPLEPQKQTREACKALLLDDNLTEINDVYHWISGEPLYLWRMDHKPSEVKERVVALGGDRFVLGAIDYFDDYRPALGVRSKKFFNRK